MSLFDDIKVSDLPSKIESNNILDAVIEIRFIAEQQTEMLVWPLYEAIKDNYNIPQITPFGRIPEEVRRENPNFREQILYKISHKDYTYSIGIGDGIFRMELGNFKYRSWQKFVDEFKSINDIVQKNIKEISRVGVRYVNVFDAPDSKIENFTLDYKLRNESLFNYSIQSIFEFPIDERIARVSVLNRVKYKYMDESGKEQLRGNKETIIIDIDVIYGNNVEKNNIMEAIEYSHTSVKKIFFGMCTDKFIKNTLRPQKEKK